MLVKIKNKLKNVDPNDRKINSNLLKVHLSKFLEKLMNIKKGELSSIKKKTTSGSGNNLNKYVIELIFTIDSVKRIISKNN